MPQLTLPLQLDYAPRKSHGGALSRGKRKTKRPLAVKKSHHVVLRSSRASGRRALIKHGRLVRQVLNKASRRFHVKVYKLAINWNHIHLSVKGQSRLGIQNFFRVLCGHLAQEILRLHPLHPPRTEKKPWRRQFWDDLVFTRIVEWGREFRSVCLYIDQNTLEAQGDIPYQPRFRRQNTS